MQIDNRITQDTVRFCHKAQICIDIDVARLSAESFNTRSVVANDIGSPPVIPGLLAIHDIAIAVDDGDRLSGDPSEEVAK